jgi:hypothetical protein
MNELIELFECAIGHDCATKISKKCAYCEIGFSKIAENPLQLTCGHVICSNCKQSDKAICQKHGEVIVGSEALMSAYFLKAHTNELFETIKEKSEKANDLYKGNKILNLFRKN